MPWVKIQPVEVLDKSLLSILLNYKTIRNYTLSGYPLLLKQCLVDDISWGLIGFFCGRKQQYRLGIFVSLLLIYRQSKSKRKSISKVTQLCAKSWSHNILHYMLNEIKNVQKLGL
ncbi:hypothetical protein A8140_09120 [Vibrio campbellii CAIM 519 = NBRC 15631 = ATCC 25920]|nr:hypothetical protein A8140_09120 [Vibrio campbellii CAIM 519 = NBRC 15631 = ATCC 25920]